MLPTTIAATPPLETRALSLTATMPVRERTTFRFPWWVWAIAVGLAIWGSFSPNPLLTPAAILILVGSVQLLWRRGEPPVLAFACAMQWLQASAAIFYTNSYGVSLEQASGGSEFERATWMSLVAVCVLALGMRLALFRSGRSRQDSLRAEALTVSIGNAFVAYLIALMIATVAEWFAFDFPGLAQPIVALIALKWMAVFIVAYCILEQRSGYFFLGFIILVEVAIGLLGYFASFKSVFFLLLVVALTSPLALRGRRLIITLAGATVLFLFAVVWSAVKAEYREFLNQGTEEQVVVVSTEERAAKLGELISTMTWDNFMDGLDAMILRLGYVKFFALTLANVPDAVPYENGALWLGALKHIVTPRLFFPGKAAISDSQRTTLYTGVQVAGEERGTSIGIGYVAESYVDFGPRWMFAPIFLLGAFYGLIYRVFVIRSRSKLISTAIASAILIFGAYTIETSNIKIVGGVVTALLVMGTMYLLFGRVFEAWLRQRQG